MTLAPMFHLSDPLKTYKHTSLDFITSKDLRDLRKEYENVEVNTWATVRSATTSLAAIRYAAPVVSILAAMNNDPKWFVPIAVSLWTIPLRELLLDELPDTIEYKPAKPITYKIQWTLQGAIEVPVYHASEITAEDYCVDKK
jgi:hypothetical protein